MDHHQIFGLDKVSFDNKENADTFNFFYENIASDLVDKLPLPIDKFGYFLSHGVPPKITLFIPGEHPLQTTDG